MPRLTRVFAGCICHYVGFVVWRLIFFLSYSIFGLSITFVFVLQYFFGLTVFLDLCLIFFVLQYFWIFVLHYFWILVC